MENLAGEMTLEEPLASNPSAPFYVSFFHPFSPSCSSLTPAPSTHEVSPPKKDVSIPLQVSITGKKRKRGRREGQQKKCSQITILEDIFPDVLSRLPVKSLMRFKSVCKSWRALFSDPFFINLHFGRAKKSPKIIFSPNIFQCRSHRFELDLYSYQLGSGSSDHLLRVDLPCSEEQGWMALHHCDGLILLSKGTQVCVCNPSTRELTLLPPGKPNSSPPGWCSMDRAAGLIYDPFTKRYMAVRFFDSYRDPHSWDISLGCEVFSLGIDHFWRLIANDLPYPIRDFKPVFLNGSVYWKINSGIVCVSLVKNIGLRFALAVPPDLLPPSFYCEFLFKGEGRLFFARRYREKQVIHMWMLKDQDLQTDVHVWVPGYSIPLPQEPRDFTPVAVQDGKILLKSECGLSWFDPLRRVVEAVIDVEPSLICHDPQRRCFISVWNQFSGFEAYYPYVGCLFPIGN